MYEAVQPLFRDDIGVNTLCGSLSINIVANDPREVEVRGESAILASPIPFSV